MIGFVAGTKAEEEITNKADIMTMDMVAMTQTGTGADIIMGTKVEEETIIRAGITTTHTAATTTTVAETTLDHTATDTVVVTIMTVARGMTLGPHQPNTIELLEPPALLLVDVIVPLPGTGVQARATTGQTGRLNIAQMITTSYDRMEIVLLSILYVWRTSSLSDRIVLICFVADRVANL